MSGFFVVVVVVCVTCDALYICPEVSWLLFTPRLFQDRKGGGSSQWSMQRGVLVLECGHCFGLSGLIALIIVAGKTGCLMDVTAAAAPFKLWVFEQKNFVCSGLVRWWKEVSVVQFGFFFLTSWHKHAKWLLWHAQFPFLQTVKFEVFKSSRLGISDTPVWDNLLEMHILVPIVASECHLFFSRGQWWIWPSFMFHLFLSLYYQVVSLTEYHRRIDALNSEDLRSLCKRLQVPEPAPSLLHLNQLSAPAWLTKSSRLSSCYCSRA